MHPLDESGACFSEAAARCLTKNLKDLVPEGIAIGTAHTMCKSTVTSLNFTIQCPQFKIWANFIFY